MGWKSKNDASRHQVGRVHHVLSSQTSNLGIIRRPWHADADLYQVRQYIRENMEWSPILYEIVFGFSKFFLKKRLPNLVRRLEEVLFKESATKEEYMNLNTLERRLQSLVKRLLHNHLMKRLRHNNPPVGTMVPTPGLQQSGNVNER